VNDPLDAKENGEHAPDFAFQFPFGELLFRLRVLTVNPALIISDNPGQEGCIVRGDLTKLLAVVDTAAAYQLSEIASDQIRNSK
jgi:hypothetical protein